MCSGQWGKSRDGAQYPSKSTFQEDRKSGWNPPTCTPALLITTGSICKTWAQVLISKNTKNQSQHRPVGYHLFDDTALCIVWQESHRYLKGQRSQGWLASAASVSVWFQIIVCALSLGQSILRACEWSEYQSAVNKKCHLHFFNWKQTQCYWSLITCLNKVFTGVRS